MKSGLLFVGFGLLFNNGHSSRDSHLGFFPHTIPHDQTETGKENSLAPSFKYGYQVRTGTTICGLVCNFYKMLMIFSLEMMQAFLCVFVGEELIVTDLSSKIEMLIPRGGDSAIQFDSMRASSVELLYIYFNITETYSSIHIDIHPDEASWDTPIEAFIRYGFYPTLDEYDLRIVLPIPEAELYSSIFNLTHNLTTNSYTWFIPENRLYAVGAYYLGVRPLTDEEESDGSRGGNETRRRQVKEIEADVNVKIYTARCLYWSTVYEQWFPHGCEVNYKIRHFEKCIHYICRH